MKNRFRITSMIFNQPLMVTDSMLDQVAHWANQQMSLNIVNLTVNGREPQMMENDEDWQRASAAREEARQQVISDTGVEVIPVHGVLVSRSMQVDACEVMTSYEQIRARLNAALANPAVEHIVMDIDSPGGSVNGVFELADEIHAARALKPITAVVNFSAFSAAYLLASAASEISISRTSGVGSIGVIAKHLDMSARNEKVGVKVTTVFAGAHKNDLSPHEPITDQAMQFLTDMVNGNYQTFVESVALYRGITADAVRATEAAVYFGQKGIDLNLADRMESAQMAVDRIAAEVRASRAARNTKGAKIAARAQAMNLQNQI